MKSRIFVVDDHPMMRRGYASLIEGEPDLELAGEAGDAPEALRLVPQVRPDLLLADIFLRGISGIELVRQLKVFIPELKVLIVSMHDETLYAERALEVGAMGYMMKSRPDEELLGAMRRVLQGHYHLSEAMEDFLLRRLTTGPAQLEPSLLGPLSNRQLEIFELIGHGFTTAEIAERLYLSRKTIESHQTAIRKKLGLRSATEVLRQAVKWVESV
jgi:DNA-binding NarL/FixJ family response regulator